VTVTPIGQRISPRLLQTRGVELGRIRIGQKGDGGRPVKLDRFRFTSAHERHIRDLAARYGGTAQPWDNGGRPQWEVITDAKAIPVIVAPASMSQWMELWSGGGCQRRCDGDREVINDTACPCEVQGLDLDKRPCKPTTRMSVMLPDLEAVGLWRVESHGWNAAAELPVMAQWAATVGTLVPAHLLLEERITIRDGQTRRFVVPVLDLEVQPRRLAELATGTAPAAITAQGSAPAIEAGPVHAGEAMADTVRDLEHRGRLNAVVDEWADLIANATTAEEVRALWLRAREAKAPDAVRLAIEARGTELAPRTDADKATDNAFARANGEPDPWPGHPHTQPDASPDVDTAYARLITTAGEHTLTLDEVDALITKVTGKPAGACDPTELDNVRLTIERGHHR
jgi:hypothetical protein